MRYKFIHIGQKTICISHFAKKEVKGTSKCIDTDSYDASKGEVIAKTRCDLKIEKLRFKHINSKIESKLNEIDKLKKEIDVLTSELNTSEKKINELEYINSLYN